MSQYTLAWGLPSIKKIRKCLSLFLRYCKLKIVEFFLPYLTIYDFKLKCI